MSKRSHRNSGRTALRNAFWLPIVLLGSMGFIYPGVILLARWFGSVLPSDHLASCTAFPREAVAIALLLEASVAAMGAAFWRRANSALFAMLTPLAATLMPVTWFFSAALDTMLCTPLPFGSIFAATQAVLLASLSWLSLRTMRRLPAVIEGNRQKWNFETMELSLAAPVFRVDNDRPTKTKTVVTIVAVIVFVSSLGYLVGQDWTVVIL